MSQNFLSQNYHYNLISGFRPKYSCKKNKKWTDCTTKGHEKREAGKFGSWEAGKKEKK